MFLSVIAYSLAGTFLKESGKIVFSRMIRDVKGCINKKNLVSYIDKEFSNIQCADLIRPETDAALESESLKKCIVDMLLCLVPVECNPLDLIQVEGLSQHDEAIVRSDLDMIIPEMREVLWSKKGFQKNIFTSGPEFQQVVMYSIKELSRQTDKLFSQLHEYIDSLIENNAKKMSCSIPESFEKPMISLCWGDDIVKAVEEAISNENSVIVSGSPGSGKTELCRLCVSNYCIRTGHKAVWMNYMGDMDSTLAEGVRLPDGYEGTVMDALYSEKNLLIVIDDYSIEKGDMGRVERIRNGCKRLYITRDGPVQGRQRCIRIRTPSDEEAVSIFASHYSEEKMEDDDRRMISEVLKSYDCNPQIASMIGELAVKIGIEEMDKGIGSHFDQTITLFKNNREKEARIETFMDDLYPLEHQQDLADTLTAVWCNEPVPEGRLAQLARTGWLIREVTDSVSTYRVCRTLEDILDNRYLKEE